MGDIFPDIEVGEVLAYSGMEIFPLYSTSGAVVDYQVAVAALASGQVSVEEVDGEGEVPHLLVTNTGETRVFFMEGEELIGGKQNRAVNTSVLAGAKSSIRMPVSCVEEFRWGARGLNRRPEVACPEQGDKMGSDMNCFSPSIRRSLRESVSASLRRRRQHTSSQREIWDEIKKEQDELGVRSPSRSMRDTFFSHRARVGEFRERLKYPAEAIGLVGVLDGQFVSFDLFDKASTCESFWSRLISSYALNRLKSRALVAAGGSQDEPAFRDIEGFIELARTAPWQAHQPVGEGIEYRARTADGMEGFALQYDGKLVHGSLLAAK